MSDTDGKCGVISDFTLWDSTRLRCQHAFEHPGLPHSWEKYRRQLTIGGAITRDEVVKRAAEGSPAAQAILAAVEGHKSSNS
jgi:hypothetical protein